MTTSENTELYDLYIVYENRMTENEDDIECFYEMYHDKNLRNELHKRLFSTRGYKLYLKAFKWELKGDIIGPIDKKTVDNINKALSLSSEGYSCIQSIDERPKINDTFKPEIEVVIKEEKVKKLIIKD